jgi:lactate permease
MSRPSSLTETHIDSRSDVLRAYARYAVIIAIFSIANITAVKERLAEEPFT